MSRHERRTMHTAIHSIAHLHRRVSLLEQRMMYFMGIDWADDKHDICVLDSTGQVIRDFQIPNDNRGTDILRKRIQRLDGPVKILIERSDGLLVDWLVRNGHTVYTAAPHLLHHRRPRRAKDDKGDAYLLAHLLRIEDPEVRPLAARSDIVEELRQLLRAYDDMVQEQRRQGNRLVYLLKQYYPAVLKLFCQPYRLIALDFLERYPNLEIARSASLDDLRQFLRDHRYASMNTEEKAIQMYNIVHEPQLAATVQNGMMTHVQVLIPILRHIYRSRYALKRRILQLVPAHPDAEWWMTIPGAQSLARARLLAWIGDDRSRFPTPNSLQATAGTAPVTRRSGKSRSVEFRTACSHKMRKALDDLARQSVKKSAWAREYYDSQITRGHGSARAYRALANRWLSIIWKLWQTNTPYDEATHISNRTRKAQPRPLQRAS